VLMFVRHEITVTELGWPAKILAPPPTLEPRDSELYTQANDRFGVNRVILTERRPLPLYPD
jgi:hypothetical protein